MKILYLAHLKNNKVRDSEEDVKYALEKLGHEVVPIDDRNFKKEDVLNVKNPDMFLFHKGGVSQGGMYFYQTMMRLAEILMGLPQKTKKVFWYFDRVWGKREKWMETIIPLVDYGFMTDETWLRRHNYQKLYPLRQGAPEYKPNQGKKKDEFPIAFVGTVYGPRMNFVYKMNQIYGKDFRVYGSTSLDFERTCKKEKIDLREPVWDDKFADVCKSSKVMVAPRFPSDAFYWSARIYSTLIYGGFMIHPKLHGMDLIDGEHYVGYKTGQELLDKIDYYLAHPKERKKIAKKGREYVLKNLKYSDRLKKMFEIING